VACAVAGGVAVFALVARDGSENSTLAPQNRPGNVVIAPRVPLRMIFHPLFKTPDHEFEAGTAFLARVPFCSDPLLLTALQNIGPAGGYYVQASGDSLDDTVSGIELREAFSGAKLLSPEFDPLPLHGTAPLGTPSASGDVAAFRARGSGHLDSGQLTEEEAPPSPGSHIWLAFGEVAPNEAEENPPVPSAPAPPRVHHGLVKESRDGLLYYTLDDPAVPLRGSAGAPLLAEGGRIIGIHLGSTTENGVVQGIATPASRFLAALREACLPAPEPVAADGKAQN